MSARVLRLVSALLVGLAVLAVLLLGFLPSSDAPRRYSTLSFEPEGQRALFLMAEALHLPVHAWHEAPGRLRGRGALLVQASPPRFEDPDRDPDPDAETPEVERPQPLGGRDPIHYRRFVEEGGTLLCLGVNQARLAALRSELGGLDELRLAREEGGRATLPDGEVVELGGGLQSVFPDVAQGVLARNVRGSPLVVSQPRSAGRVVLVGLSAAAFTNRALAEEPGAALLLVRLVEALGPFDAVLFDEFALGGWRPRTLLDLAREAHLDGLGLQVLLLATLLLWRALARGPFPRDPAPSRVGSPLARAHGFARLLERAGRFDLLARLLRQGLIERWSTRAGRARAAVEGHDVGPLLRTLARGDPRLEAHARELLSERRIEDAAGLARLDSDLARLEARAFAAADSNRANPGADSVRSGS